MSFLCTVSPGLLQWTGLGIVAAVFLFGLGLGTRQGYKMGRDAQRTLDGLAAKHEPGPRRPAA